MRSAAQAQGLLYLVPAPLDFGCNSQTPLEHVMPSHTLQVASQLEHWICENAKSTRAYLKRVQAWQTTACVQAVPAMHPIQALKIQELPHKVHKKGDPASTDFDARPLLQAAVQGHAMGLVSEAGMPGIADPGASVVRAAYALGLQVVPLVGPVSLALALAASGLNGQNFAFVGYLPQDATQRTQRIKALEALALKTGQTQLFIETPYRNSAVLASLLHTLQPSTRLALGCGLTLSSHWSYSGCVKDWTRQSAALTPPLDLPAVFGIGV